MYSIITLNDGQWGVRTQWHGELRIVKTGTIIECADYVRECEAQDEAGAA